MGNRIKNILAFKDLEIGFTSGKQGRSLLPPLNGSAGKGELIAVIGKNGIGKSTLLRTFTGLQASLAGELTIYGKSVTEYSRVKLSEKIGYISTEIIKVSNMRVYDLVSLGRFPHTNWLGRINKVDHLAILEAINKAGMSEFIDRPITELSDGERQRAMVAMVLAQDPGVMIMDEPTAFLDISSKFEVMQLMHELTRSREKTIIFSTHDLTSALNQADKIWLLKEQGVFEGAPEDLMLEGSFNTLFDDKKIHFNSNDGSFTIRNDEKGNVNIIGDGIKKYWTEKALLRAGYAVVNSESTVEVKVPAPENSNWKCRIHGACQEFDTIYELVKWIRDNNSIS